MHLNIYVCMYTCLQNEAGGEESVAHGLRNNASLRDTALVEEYLREINEAKLLLVICLCMYACACA